MQVRVGSMVHETPGERACSNLGVNQHGSFGLEGGHACSACWAHMQLGCARLGKPGPSRLGLLWARNGPQNKSNREHKK